MEILLIIIGVLSLFLYVWYAKIISRRNAAQSALSSIDVQLTKRSELVPNILAIAKRFMEHEKSLIEDVTSLRAKATEGYDAICQHRRIVGIVFDCERSGSFGGRCYDVGFCFVV